MKKNKVKALLLSLLVVLLVYLAYLPGPGTFLYDFRRSNSFFGVIEWISLFSVAATFILVFFSEKIFTRWFKYFAIWFLPLAIIFSATGSGSELLQPSSDELAILCGEILVVVTLLFALAQRFYYKIK